MSRHFITAIFFCALPALSVSALDVECRPGQLSAILSDPSQVAELRLTGTADASDFFFMGSSMPALRTVDLSAVTIAAYEGLPVGGRSVWPASTIPDGAFAGSPVSSVTFPSGSFAIGEYAFAASRLTELSLPAGVTSVGMAAFAACPDLTDVTLAPGASYSGYVFHRCPSLASVNLAGVTEVPEMMFADCTALASVTASDALAVIGTGAFESCGALTSFGFGKDLRTLGAEAFDNSGLVTVDLAASSALTSVGAWAFAHCRSLTDAVLPASVSTAGEGLFFDCPSLAVLTLPDRLAGYSDYMLGGASSLGSVSLGSGLDTIGRYALKGSAAIGLKLPSSLTLISDGAMEGMTALSHIDASALDEVPQLGTDVFKGVEQSKVVLTASASAIDAFRAAPQWQEFDIQGTTTDEHLTAVPSAIRGRFEGALLLVEASGTTIAALQLFTLSGLLLDDVAIDSDHAAVDTSAHSDAVYVVVCTLSDGRSATLKIAR